MNPTVKRLFCILTAISLSLFFTGCAMPSSRIKEPDSYSFFALDTYITLTIYDAKRSELFAPAEQLVKEYEAMFSATMPGSDIYKINHSDGDWVCVSDETVKLLNTALDYCSHSENTLDITLLPVKDLWDFTGEDPQIPPKQDLQAALSHVSTQNIQINRDKVRLTDSLSQIDLGFIAKGYICDRLRDYLVENGVSSALLALGGNISVIGTKPDGTPFKVGIQKPFATLGTPADTVSLSGISAKTGEYSCAVTSGIYERYFEKDGRLYHHILDPSTGYPVENDLASVTILSDSSTDADAMSTLCLALGLQKATAYIESQTGVDAVFITKKDQKIIPVYGNTSANR